MATVAAVQQPLVWTPADSAERAETSRQQWRGLIEAALLTSHYQMADFCTVLESALESATPAEAIAGIPPVPLTLLYSRHRDFAHPNPPAPQAAPLHAPWKAETRVVAFCPWFALPCDVPAVLEDDPNALALARPQAVAAPVDHLRRLASSPTIEIGCGLLAFSGPGRSLLTLPDRDLVWQSFGVPVAEQFRGFLGELIASDCEAHDGLHLHPDKALCEIIDGRFVFTSLGNLRHPVLRLDTGIAASLDNTDCGCGNRSPRVRFATPVLP